MFVGSPFEDGFSFPSGHVTACAAGMTALSLMKGKKLVVPSVVIVLLMAISRNYLMAHYPSDVLVAAIIGVASGFIAWVITRFIFRFLEDRRDSMPIAELARVLISARSCPSTFPSSARPPKKLPHLQRRLRSHLRRYATAAAPRSRRGMTKRTITASPRAHPAAVPHPEAGATQRRKVRRPSASSSICPQCRALTRASTKRNKP